LQILLGYKTNHTFSVSKPMPMGPIDIKGMLLASASSTWTYKMTDSPPPSPAHVDLPPVSPLQPGSLALPDAVESLPPITGPSLVTGMLLNSGTASDDDLLIVKCGGCSASNVLILPKDCWYIVFCGEVFTVLH